MVNRRRSIWQGRCPLQLPPPCHVLRTKTRSYPPNRPPARSSGAVKSATSIPPSSARAGRWPAWAAQPLANRIELVRRFVNEVRKEHDKFAELIARETGKPMWEARSEVEAVIAKVEISIRAYAERTGQRKLDSALQGTCRGEAQAARRDGGARTVQFPGAPAERAYRPGADCRQRGDLQAEREDARGRRVPDEAVQPRGDQRGAGPGADRRARGGQGAGRASRRRRRAVHRLGAGRHRDQPQARRQSGQDRRARDGRQQSASCCGTRRRSPTPRR